MKIISRVENPLLGRVELEFQIQHKGQSTPSRSDVVTQVVAIEPGAKANLVVVKNTKTRFGQASTTGIAFVYSDEESLSVEPKYVFKRQGEINAASSDEDGGEA